jgi:hypothetical protein
MRNFIVLATVTFAVFARVVNMVTIHPELAPACHAQSLLPSFEKLLNLGTMQ